MIRSCVPRFRVVILFILTICCANVPQAQTLGWGVSGGSGAETYGKALDMDRFGNLYLCGLFGNGNAGFDTSFLTINGVQDGFAASYRADGTLRWAKQLGGTLIDEAKDIAADPDGNCIVLGSGNLLVAPPEKTHKTLHEHDAFLVKFDSGGTVLWDYSVKGDNETFGDQICTDAAGNVFFSGTFKYHNYFGTDTLPTRGEMDIFVAKLDKDAVFKWARAIGGFQDETSSCLTAGLDGRVIAAGAFKGNCIFDWANAYTSSYADYNIFISSWTGDGDLEFYKVIEGPGNEYPAALSFTADSSILIGGNYRGSLIFGTDTLFNNGPASGFIVKMDPSGNVRWKKKIGGSGSAYVNAVDELADGRILVTGFHAGDCSIDGATIPSFGSMDSYIVLLDASGNFLSQIIVANPLLDGITGAVAEPSGGFTIGGYHNGYTLFGNDTLYCDPISADMMAARFCPPDTLILQPLSTSQWCRSSRITAEWNAQGCFSPHNTFRLELSDSVGNFSSPFVLDSSAGVYANSPFEGTLPMNTAPGNGYRLRICSTHPTMCSIVSDSLVIRGDTALALTVTGDSLICPPGGSAQFAASGGFSSYLWSSLQNTPSISVTTPGVYTVTASDTSGCISQASWQVDLCIAREDPKAPFSFSWWPNPVHEQLHVQSPENRETRVSVLNMEGQQLMRQTLSSGSGSLDTETISPGMYIIRIEQGAHHMQDKFVKF